MGNKSDFAIQLHREMCMYRVRAHDLAWLMGCRWSSWLREPDWDPNVGWFVESEPGFKYPKTKREQQKILKLVRRAQDNPEYWRRRYAELKSVTLVLDKGLRRSQAFQNGYLRELVQLRMTPIHVLFWSRLRERLWHLKVGLRWKAILLWRWARGARGSP